MAFVVAVLFYVVPATRCFVIDIKTQDRALQ